MQETQEMQVRSPDREDPPEKEMATHSSILAWEIPWTEEPGGLQFIGSQRVGHDWATEHAHTFDVRHFLIITPGVHQGGQIKSYRYITPNSIKFPTLSNRFIYIYILSELLPTTCLREVGWKTKRTVVRNSSGKSEKTVFLKQGCCCCLVTKSFSLWAYGLCVTCQVPQPMGWPRQDTGEGSQFLLPGIFLTQESDPHSWISCIGRATREAQSQAD